MKKIWLKRTIRIAALVLAVLLLIAGFARGDRNYIAIKAFYTEPRDSMDIIFLGASEAATDVSAVYAFERTGLTGYQYGLDSNLPSVYLPQLQNILSRQSPQLIVVEVNGFLVGEDVDLYDESIIRTYLDPTPLSRHKYETLSRLELKEDLITYLLPFINTHAQWEHPRSMLVNMLTQQQIALRGYSLFKGYTTRPVQLRDEKERPLPGPEDKLPLGRPEVEALFEEFVSYCQDNDVKVVFVRFPHLLASGQEVRAYQRFLTIRETLEIRNIPCLDLQERQTEIGLTQADYYNDSHLNIYGQEKLTAYLMDHLCADYSLQARTLPAAEQKQWKTCVDYYHALRERAVEMMADDAPFLLEETPIVLNLRARLK